MSSVVGATVQDTGVVCPSRSAISLTRLLPTSLWLFALLWLVLLIAFQCGLFWLHLPYDQTPDQDIVLAYNGLVMNAGLPQEYFDHTGYIYFLLLAPWFKLLHALGFVPSDTLTALPHVSDPAAFEIAWQKIIEAGRSLTVVILAAFTIVLAVLTGRLFDDRRIGFFAAFAFATGAGAVSQIGVMRTEPLSALFVVTSTLLIVLAATGKWIAGRFLLLGLAAFFGVLAVLTKVFAFVPLASLPLIAVAFGTSASTLRQPASVRRKRAMLLIAAALLVGIPAAMLIVIGFSEAGTAVHPFQPVAGGLFGYYQAWFALWILACMAIYAVLWGVPLEDSLSAIAALVIGVSLGLMFLLIRYNVQNVIAATHPVEQMFVFAAYRDHSLAQQSTVLGGTLLTKLKDNAWSVFVRHFTNPTSDNLFPVELFVVASILVGFCTRDRRWIVSAGLLLFVSWTLQCVFLLRFSQQAYHIYSDPFTIMGAAVVLDRFRASLLTPVGSIAVVFGLLSYGFWGLQAESVWSSSSPGSPYLCRYHDGYLKRLEPFPFCP
jgi:hypothetical protein